MFNQDINAAHDLLSNTQLEFSSASPQSLKESQPLIDQVHDVFLGKWGKYISQERRKLASLSVRYPILTDASGMKESIRHDPGIKGLVRNYQFKQVNLDGYVEYIDDLGVIKLYSYKSGINRISEKMRSQLIGKYISRFPGDQNRAQEFIDKLYFQTVHAHESAHACSDESVPMWFQEIGARYYESETIKEIYGKRESRGSDALKNHRFYEQLIDSYGDEVHKYFFGNEVDSKTKREILIKSFMFIVKDLTKRAFTP